LKAVLPALKAGRAGFPQARDWGAATLLVTQKGFRRPAGAGYQHLPELIVALENINKVLTA